MKKTRTKATSVKEVRARSLIREAKRLLNQDREEEKMEDLKRILSQIEHCEKTLAELKEQLQEIAEAD